MLLVVLYACLVSYASGASPRRYGGPMHVPHSQGSSRAYIANSASEESVIWRASTPKDVFLEPWNGSDDFELPLDALRRQHRIQRLANSPTLSKLVWQLRESIHGPAETRAETLRRKFLQEANHTAGSTTDANTLLAVKEQWTDPSQILSSWDLLINPSVCQNWTGVACSSSGRVTSLNLTRNVKSTIDAIGGHLPFSLLQLTQLRELIIVNHNFTFGLFEDGPDSTGPFGSLPPGTSSQLQHINISSNLLSGPLPSFIGALPLVSLDLSNNGVAMAMSDLLASLSAANQTLQILHISHAAISGPMPADIQNFGSLLYLDLTWNNLTGQLAPEVGQLKKLQSLRLSSNSLSGSLPDELGSAAALVELSLAYNQLSGQLPLSLGQLKNLTSIILDQNLLDGTIDVLFNCTSLAMVSLTENQLNGSLSESQVMKLNASLEQFFVTNNNLSGAVPSAFGKCRKLTNLELAGNMFSGALPPDLCSSNQLQTLFADQNELQGNLPPELGNCTSLRVLSLSGNNFSGPIPSSYASDLKLSIIGMANNTLTGPFPQNLTGWVQGKMQELELQNNSIGGELPDEVGLLQNLHGFNVAQNRISGLIPDSFGNCTILGQLYLYSNNFSGTLPASLGNVQMKFFRADVNNLGGPFPLQLTNDWSNSLHMINISNNNFYGELPPELAKVQNLQHLGLSYNRFNGTLPKEWASLVKLLSFRVEGNLLEGEIPSEYDSFNSVLVFYATSNNFSGTFPEAAAGWPNIKYLRISHNNFSGPIPTGLWLGRNSLWEVNFGFNNFDGHIPSALASLPALQVFRVEHNKLTGNIPSEFAEAGNLTGFNVSYNDLSGVVPAGNLTQFPASSFDGNPGLCAAFLNRACHKKSILDNGAVLAGIIVGSLLVITSIFLSLWMYFKGIRLTMFIKRTLLVEGMYLFEDVGEKLTVEQIAKLTNNFSEESQMKCGGQATVFKVTLANGRELAVKKLNSGYQKIPRALRAEILSLQNLHHRHLANLVGCGMAGDTVVILYDFIQGGDLDEFVWNSRGKVQERPWSEVKHVLVGAARGLEYLHHGSPTPVIHRDIKPANILVGPNHEGLLTDFGLSRVVHPSKAQLTTVGAGTIGYIAPECTEVLRVSTASDVYSFGILLLVVLTGKRPTSVAVEDVGLLKWVKMGDLSEIVKLRWPELEAEEQKEVMSAVKLALNCCAEAQSERPDMTAVVSWLQRL